MKKQKWQHCQHHIKIEFKQTHKRKNATLPVFVCRLSNGGRIIVFAVIIIKKKKLVQINNNIVIPK